MPKIIDLIARLLPEGTNPEAKHHERFSRVPFWPPDLFAVVATLVDRSACYAHPDFTRQGVGNRFDEAYRREVRDAGRSWGEIFNRRRRRGRR